VSTPSAALDASLAGALGPVLCGAFASGAMRND
jgi:hypothetical protein